MTARAAPAANAKSPKAASAASGVAGAGGLYEGGNMTAIAKREQETAVLAAADQREPSIGAILASAVQSGMPPEALEKIVALHERMQAKQAEREFAQARAAFKAECPPIVRRTPNGQFTRVDRNGVQRPFLYASLEDIAATIDPVLAKHGLSYWWNKATVNEQGLTMECVVAHEGGHRESSSATFPVDSRAGSSGQQKMGAAMTYCQRYSLVAALGLTSCDEDVDGNHPPPSSQASMTDDQSANLLALIDELGERVDVPAFCRYFKVERPEDLPAAQFVKAIRMLEAKRP